MQPGHGSALEASPRDKLLKDRSTDLECDSMQETGMAHHHQAQAWDKPER